jgi:hypothetical protein
MSNVVPIRRLRLVREAGEPRIAGRAAVRRYRLARLEEVAELDRATDQGRSASEPASGERGSVTASFRLPRASA